MKNILEKQLKIFTRWILDKYKPTVIAITGSIGKTTSKEAIYHVLKDKLRVRASFKNYNNEIGVPLTVIGAESPGRNYLAWFKVFYQALKLVLISDKSYPEVLIIELGVDRPGDMKYLSEMIKPKIAVVTYLSYSHLEYFGNLNNIKKEKQILVESLTSDGLAILNIDNEFTKKMAEVSKARVFTYGYSEGADLKIQDVVYNFSKAEYDLSGVNFKLNYQGSIVPVYMKNVISESALYSALVATSLALHFKFNLIDIANSLRDFSLPAGRMNLLAGVKHSFLIDDTYNASPEASISALKTLGAMQISPEAKKYAVLGEMLEIGVYTEEGHQLVGQTVFNNRIDVLIAVGEKSRDYIRGAKSAGMDENSLFYFDRAEEAGRFLQNRINSGDLLLIKGSQGSRMEKVSKELLSEPQKAVELLVRQETEWQD